MQDRAAKDLSSLVAAELQAAALSFARIRDHATPRRLTLVVEGLPVRQADRQVERGDRRWRRRSRRVTAFWPAWPRRTSAGGA